MSAQRRLSDDLIDPPIQQMSGFRPRTPVVRLVAEKREPLPPAGQFTDAEKPGLSGDHSDHRHATAFHNDAAEPVIGPDEGSSSEHDDAPAPYAWAGKLICILTAATTGTCLLLAIL